MNRREVLFLSLITLFTVIVWITLGIYHARRATVVTQIQMRHTIPLTPTFDQDIINGLTSREE
jgi:hypothetical protein